MEDLPGISSEGRAKGPTGQSYIGEEGELGFAHEKERTGKGR